MPTWKPCRAPLFIYGTLLPGGRAHRLLRDLGATRVGPALLQNHRLYHFVPGDYPLAFPGKGRVRGEVWEIPLEALMILDIYEGVAEGLYERRLLEVSTTAGLREAWVYRATPRAMGQLRDKLKRVSGDDWLAWKRGTSA